MQRAFFGKVILLSVSAGIFLTACGQPAGNMNSNSATMNANSANSNANSSNVNASANTNLTSSAVTVEAKEPEQYQAKVTLKLEATGEGQAATLPAITANVARNSGERMMEFTLPNGEKVVYLDKAGTNYLILPNKKQYAELNKESLGFEVRRMLMPEQIVNQVKTMPGVQRVGEENVNGRQVVKYSYSGTANTQTQAGKVSTESFILVDKETGLPIRSETVSQSQTGGNVQGYKGLRFVTDMTDIKTTVEPTMFALPADYQKIDSEQVKAQVNLIFNAVTMLVGQALKQTQTNPMPANAPTATPAQ
jgi:hypothetical protein